MSVARIENILSEELYEECIQSTEKILNHGGNALTTNQWWNFDIRKDSFPVFVHNIISESDLHRSLKETIERKSKLKVYDGNIMFYYWTRFSYIPWHSDQLYDGAITIYLNRDWDVDFGGLFLHSDAKDRNDIAGSTIQAIVPERNLGLVQTGGVLHCTTPVNFDGGMRITIQAFLNKE
jgi:hypothetical protein